MFRWFYSFCNNLYLFLFLFLLSLEFSGGFNYIFKVFIFFLCNKEELQLFKSIVIDLFIVIYRDLENGLFFGWCDICIENNVNNNMDLCINFGDFYFILSGV